MSKRPNFLVIMSDQHRGDAMSCAGHSHVMTPTLDHLAARGVRFEHAYSTCPVCIPARRSFLSGQFPSTHGMLNNKDGCEWYPEATLPGELSKAGYHTCLVGRHMHQFPRRKRFGFDHVVHTGNMHEDDEYPQFPGYGEDPVKAHGLHPNGWTARPWHLDDSLHPTHRTVDSALRFLKRRDPSCPFFLVASFVAPHPPLNPPSFYFDRYLRTGVDSPIIGGWAEKPEGDGGGLHIGSFHCNLTGESLLSCKAGYYGLINHLDDQVQRLIWSGLELCPEVMENTWIIYTSDHGEMLGDHYRFRKNQPFEGSSHIPLIICPPAGMGGMDNGAVRSSAAILEDVMPTILDLAGVKIPDSVDGKSLAPLLKRGAADVIGRDFVHGENGGHTEVENYHYLTDGKVKYIWFSQDGRELLFDLERDPWECEDIARREDSLRQRWRLRLAKVLKDRCEGFSDGKQLFPGRKHERILPHVSEKR
ncbi:MAG: sulfatase-like hydrolase/transferase [Puniceicoccales bacterium]